MRDLLDLSRDRATLLFTHRLVGPAATDEILVLDGSCVVERGREDDLLRRQGQYPRL
jgi:ATP-binding cassette subfamily C protein CydC